MKRKGPRKTSDADTLNFELAPFSPLHSHLLLSFYFYPSLVPSLPPSLPPSISLSLPPSLLKHTHTHTHSPTGSAPGSPLHFSHLPASVGDCVLNTPLSLDREGPLTPIAQSELDECSDIATGLPLFPLLESPRHQPSSGNSDWTSTTEVGKRAMLPGLATNGVQLMDSEADSGQNAAKTLFRFSCPPPVPAAPSDFFVNT